MRGHRFAENPAGAFGGVDRSGVAPVFEVAPVRQQRRVERGLEAVERVGGSEEVPAMPDIGDRVQPQRRLAEFDGLEQLGEHLQDLDVDDEFLGRDCQAALKPARPVQNHVGAAHDRAPEGHLGLVGRLRVRRVRRRRRRGAHRQVVAAGQLARAERRLDVFGGSEGGRAGAHVDVAGEAPVADRGARPDDLRQGDAGERLGVLQNQGAGQRDRRHRPGEGERREDHHLPRLGGVDDSPAHQLVENQRGVGIRHRVADRGVGERLRREAMGDSEYLVAVRHGFAAAEVDEGNSVGQDCRRAHHVQMPHAARKILRLDDRPEVVNHVEALGRLREVVEVRLRAGAAPSLQIGAVRRSGRGRDADAVAAEDHGAAGGPAVHEDLGGRLGDQFLQPVRIEPDHVFVGDRHARAGVEAPRLLAQYPDADRGERLQGGPVDRLDLVGAELLDRRIGVPPLPPRGVERLFGAGRPFRPLCAAAAAASGAHAPVPAIPPVRAGAARLSLPPGGVKGRVRRLRPGVRRI